MINNTVLVGRLTRDPDLRYTSNGIAAASFTLAVNRNFTNASGEREADFINCVIWRKAAENLANYARKGTLIGITGRIQTRNYENQQGQRVYVTEVVADNFQLLEKRQDNSGGGYQNNQQGNYNQNNFNNTQNQNQTFRQSSMPGLDERGFNTDSEPFGRSNKIEINDDDLPF
ncbi:single-stranded DNA-binding protein [Vagococcus lutrae]|uniref:single-stranded DNA-binding protein n=1 Tax=Vagococcus lutrae TaxID=81947 RepID=UPI00200BD25F|nr:single-stranded DNA-binding protein [Vagococcus lutrae]UQF11347.1 single-stranded DNA-binding protein [Vagococcus lutrae]UQF24225.1 single-stranded DNA-binding protein [Vagococcus lutrae]UQF63685.1 single-stranded DNA-binding protein [Vagococcus lutrae]